MRQILDLFMKYMCIWICVRTCPRWRMYFRYQIEGISASEEPVSTGEALSRVRIIVCQLYHYTISS